MQGCMLAGREAETLAFLRGYCEEHGWAPTVREIGAAIGESSTSQITRILDRLEAKRRIARLGTGSSQTRSRAIRIIDEGD